MTAPATRQPSTSSQLQPRSGCRVETLEGGTSAAKDRWLRLFEQAGRGRMHHHPDYLAAVLPGLKLDPWALTCGEKVGEQSMAIFIPKRMKFGRQPLPGARSSMIGVRLAGFGLLGSDGPDNVAAIVEAAAQEVIGRHIPVVEFEEVQEHSHLWQQLLTLAHRGFQFVPSSEFDAHRRVRLPQTVDEYWQSFKSKTRYTLRKKRRQFGEYTVTRYDSVADIDPFLAAAHQVSQHTWQTHQLGLRVKASDEELKYLTFLTTQGAFRSYVLFREQEPVAFVMGHQWGGVFHYDEVGFDRRVADLSPGNVLLQEIIDDLLSHNRPDVLDFGLGDADYKRQFANEETRSATVWMFAPGARNWWQVTSMRLRRKIAHLARGMATEAGLAASMRRYLRDRAAKSD